MRKIKKKLILFLLVSFSNLLYSASFYYYEDFTTGFGASQPEWQTNLSYGRDGIVFGLPRADQNATRTIGGGVLQLTGSLYDNVGWGAGTNQYAYEGHWVNHVVYNTNKFDATATSPFGVEAIRTFADLDSYTGGGDIDYLTRHGVIGFWLYVDDLTNHTTEWQTFENFIELSDHVGDYEIGAGNQGMKQRLSYYNGSEIDFDLTKAKRPDGRTIDLSLIGNWDYGLYNVNSTPNNNDITFRITHNGNYINFYMNANPANVNANGFPDEFCLIGQKQVIWNTNIQFMFNHEQQCESFYPAASQKQDVNWDDVLVKSAVDSSIAAISPTQILVDTNIQNITLSLTNSIILNNAGINYIHIEKPTNIKWLSSNLQDLTNYIVVRNHYDNNITERTLQTVWYQPGAFPADNEVAILTNNANDFYLLLGSQITNMSVGSENISIDMQIIQSNEFAPPLHFSVYVMAEQFDAMVASKKQKYSTAGWQLCTGTPDLYRKLDPAVGYASITPSEIIQGSSSYNFTYYIGSGNEYTEDIKQLAIAIPPNFTMNTNSVDSFLLSSDSNYITITTNSQLCGTSTNLIIIDYASASKSIPAGGGLDTITFSIKGTVSKGNEQWKSFVDGVALDNNSTQTKTNSTFRNQFVHVLGAPPDVAAGITKPINTDPVVLFNTITANTLEYTIENRASSDEVDNKIWIAVLTVPAIFTNLQIISDNRLTNSANIVIHQGIGTVSTITLYYSHENNPILPGGTDSDVLSILAYHSITNNQTTNVSFSLVVDNSNGQGFLSNTIDMIQNLQVTDPYPIGTVDCYPTDGIIYTSDTTNQFVYKIYNSAPSGKILYANIEIPTNYFTFVTNISSSLVTNGISKNGLNIHIDYTIDNHPIDVGQVDTITFTAVDKYTNISVPDSTIIPSQVANNTKTNDTTDKDSGLGLTRNIDFVPQEARVSSYLTNGNLIRTEVTVSTLYYVFQNNGDEGNVVQYAEGTFSGSGGGTITSISNVTGSLSGAWNISGLQFSKTNYNLLAGQKDVLTIIINDNITSETYRDIIPKVTVNTSVLVIANKPTGKTNRVYFKIPPPVAKGKIFPNQMFLSSSMTTNYFQYTIYNDGDGSNELDEAVIFIPSILNGKVTALSNSWMNSTTYITNKSDRIIIDYKNYGNSLDSKATDVVYLQIQNNIALQSNLTYSLEVANNDGKGLYPTTDLVPNGNIVNVIGQPDGYIDSPNAILDSTISNMITYKIFNPSNGQNIIFARIKVPTSVYSLNPSTLNSAWLSSVASYSNATGYIYINFSANPVLPNNIASVSFKVSDTINKNTNTTIWSSDAQYDVGGSFLSTGTNSGTQKLPIVLDSASAMLTVSPLVSYITTTTNTFNLKITNTGMNDNYLSRIRIYYSGGVSPVLSAITSTIISNDVGNIVAGANYVQFDYLSDSHLLNAGTADSISFVLSDSISSVSSVTLRLEADNHNPAGSFSTLNSSIIDYTVPANVYIAPNTADVTKTSNTFTYRINNSGANTVNRAVLLLPSIFTNIVNISSSHLAESSNIIYNNSSITLNYFNDSNGLLEKNGSDVITFTAFDTLSTGTSNVSVFCQIDDGNGFVDTLETSGQSWAIAFYMPSAYGAGYIYPQEVYTTSITNRFVYIITNTGNGSNGLEKALIQVPAIYTNIIMASNSHCANQGNVRIGNLTSITLNYASDANGLLMPTEKDTIVFKTIKNSTNIGSGYTFVSKIDNGDGNGFVLTGDYAGQTKNVSVGRPASVSVSPINLETTTTSNLYTFSIDNSGAGSSSSIYKVKIIIPAMVTNIQILSNVSVATSMNYSGNAITLLYSDFSYPGGDTFKFVGFDNKDYGNTNVSFLAYVNKNDGNNWVLADNISMDVQFSMPDASANAKVMPVSVSTIPVTNSYSVIITNIGTAQNTIKIAKIQLPSLFSSILTNTIDSALLSNESNSIEIRTNNIYILYYKENSFIPTKAKDTITFQSIDTITEETDVQMNIFVANQSNETALIDTGIITGGSKSIEFSKPDAQCLSYVTPNSVSVFDSGISYQIVVSNSTPMANSIYHLRIYFNSVLTNLTSLNSALLVNDSINITTNMSGHYIDINYEGLGETNLLTSQSKDIITFIGYHNVSVDTQTTYSIYFDNNNGNGYIKANLWMPYSLNVLYSVPSPQGASSITPSIIMADSVTNVFSYVVTNLGLGNNALSQVVINVPSGISAINGVVSAQGATIITNLTAITLSYPSGLSTGSKDTITLNIVDNINAQSNIAWTGFIKNSSSGLSNLSSLYSGAQTVKILNRPNAKITPTIIFDSYITNDFSYEIYNPINGASIYYAKIQIPTSVYSKILNLNNTWGNAISVTNAGFISIDYSAQPLLSGQKDIISFKALDNVNKNTNTSIWLSYINYNDGMGYRLTSSSSGTQSVFIQKDSASADGYLSPNQVLLDSTTNNLIYTLQNTGVHENYIKEAYIYFNPSQFTIKSAVAFSSILTNDSANVIVNNTLGYIYLRYDQENYLQSGETDTITFSIIDTITNQTISTLVSKVDNNDGNGLVDTTSISGQKTLSFVPAGVDAYVTPVSIDSTTTTNIFTYRINNSGGNSAYMIIINVPSVFTNIVAVNSTHLGNQLNIRPNSLGNISSITLDYQSDGNTLDNGENDIVTITAIDSIAYQSTNVVWSSIASNSLGLSSVLETGGQSQTVNFVMPSPNVAVGIAPNEIYYTSTTNVFMYSVTNKGTGTSDIFNLVINVPSLFTNITMVSSAHMLSQPSISGNISSFTLHYSLDGNQKLKAGENDFITIKAINSANGVDDTQNWTSLAQNQSSGSFISTIGNVHTTIASPPLVSITPNQIYTTTESNFFTYIIDNSGAGGNSTIYDARITIPGIMTNVSAFNTATNSIISVSNGFVWIQYTSGLAFTKSDTLTLLGKDNFSLGNTNLVWNCEVNKNDNNGYQQTVTAAGKTVSVDVVMPQTFGQFAVVPNNLNTVVENYTYTNYIYNYGNDLNNILMARIVLPLNYTNINSITSSISSDISVTNGVITIYYTNASLITSTTDIVTLDLDDNILLNTNVVWNCYVANTLNTNDFVSTGILPGYSKNISYTKPAVASYAYAVTNSISAFSLSNYFTIAVSNSGVLHNDIYSVKIEPPQIFTNITALTSSKLGNNPAILKYTNNFIFVDYSSFQLLSGEKDYISFYAFDNITTATSVHWLVSANNQDGNGLQNSTEWLTKGSLNLNVFVPSPDVSVGINPNLIFEDTITNVYTFLLNNNGTGNNEIRRAVIQFPTAVSVIQADSSWINNDGANLIVNNSSVTLTYQNDTHGVLTVGSNDVVTIYGIDTYSGEGVNFDVVSLVDNGSGTLSATLPISNGANSVKVIYRPTASVLPSEIESESITNHITYSLKNTGLQGATIQQAKIVIPSHFSLISNSVSTVILTSFSNISYGSNYFLLNYASDAGDFSKTLNETIQFDVVDDLVKQTNTSVWESYVNYNDGYGFHSTGIITSKSKNIFTKFSAPKAHIVLNPTKIYTSAVTNQLTYIIHNDGIGSNYISRVRIYYPNSKVTINASDVTSALVTGTYILSGADYIEVQYKNSGNLLSAQTSDTLHITMSDVISSVSAITLSCLLDNSILGSGTITNKASGDGIINFGTPPDVGISPRTLDTTIQSNIYLTYKIHNNSFQPIKKAVITFPSIITNYGNVQSSILNSTNSIMKSATSFTLDYENDPVGSLSLDTSDYITFSVLDNFDKGFTNVQFSCFVDAGQGYVDTITNTDTTKKVFYLMPNASASAYIQPNKITTVSLSNEFIYVISNKGYGSDRIDKIKITIPTGFTSVTNITGKFFSSSSSIEKGSGYFAINYYAETNYIPAQTIETLHFTAYDSISTVGDYAWLSQVDNMSGGNLQDTIVPSGEKQIVTTSVPDFTAKVSISPNYIYSTTETNHIFSIYLNNQSLNNQLEQARILVPIPELDTNVIVSSTVLGTSNISLSNNMIRLDYLSAGLPLSAGGGSDSITIKAFDTFTNNVSSNNWQVQVKHNTAVDFANAQLLTPSDSFKLVMLMPDAEGIVSISPQNIYTVQTNINFVYTLSNAGSGKNYITELQIVVPEFFTNGLSGADISSLQPGATVGFNSLTRIATINYMGNMLPVGAKDQITLNVHNSCTNVTNGIFWQSYVKNGVPYYTQSETSELFYQSKYMNVKQSSARFNMVVNTLSNQNFIYTTDISNQMKVTVRNTGSDGDFIKQMFIHIPTSLLATNIYNISSEKISGTFISLPADGSPITLNYSSAGYSFGYGDSDTITFTMLDNITAETTMHFNAEANFSNNLGYIPAEEFYPGAKDISVINPPLQARVELKTPVIYTSESNTTRSINFSVLNKGVGLNELYYVKLEFTGPYVPFINNIDSPLLNSLSISNVNATNIIATLNYTITPIPTQQEEIITISLTNYLIADEHYNLEIKSWLKNSPSGQYFLPTEQGDTTLDIVYGNKTIYKANIVYDSQVKNDDATIYTINHSATIHYEILNKSPKWDITETLIQLGSYMSNLQIESLNHPTASISLSNSFAHIIYPTNDLLLFGSYDTIKISFSYNESMTNVTAMSSSVMFNDGSGWHSHYRTNEQAFYLKEAFWGQLEGHVFPTFKSINVKLYDVNTGKQVIDVFTNSILYTTSDSNGNYKIDLIPEGVYNIKYYDEEGQFLSAFYMTNIQVLSNNITFLSQVYMKNAPIRFSAPSGTCIYCYDDNEQSYLCVPSDSVFSDFYLDIYIKNMTESQKNKLNDNTSILVSDTTGLQVFYFDLRDLSFKPLDSTKLKLSGKITLHYDPTLIANKGWNENSLSIYYWNDKLNRWIKLGGTINTAQNIIQANVNYLNTYYAILPSVNKETGLIQNVTIAPNPFTPFSEDETFHNVAISFTLSDYVDSVVINIFNLKGELVRKLENLNIEQGNVMAWWDGKDRDGYLVPGGAYIYQIRADKKVYSGTILLLK